MKTAQIFLIPCLLVGLMSTAAQAQGQYQKAMNALVVQIDTTKGELANLTLANSFARIAEVEKTNWLPYYYASYCTALEAVGPADVAKVDLLCEQAEKYLDQADLLSPKNSEVYCLRSLISLAKIRVNQMARGMSGILQAQAALETANTYDQENPRVYFMMGQQAFNTPEAFGGSKANALRYFEKTLALLDAQKDRESTIDVHWGRDTTTKMIAICQKKLQIAGKTH